MTRLPADSTFSELSQFELDRDSIRSLPLTFCQRSAAVILGSIPGPGGPPVIVGLLDPDNADLLQTVGRQLGKPVTGVQLNRYEIHKALEFAWGQFPPDAHVLDLDSTNGDIDGAEPADMLDQFLVDAIRRTASDVHIERYMGDVDLRLRIDGILHQIFTHLDPDAADHIIGRLKVLASLDITERRRPQDGRFRATLTGGGREMDEVDFRVSIVPGPAGEDAVIRILDSEVGLLPVDQLGLAPELLETFLRLVNNPEGMLMVTGPTGSGKTTTLYATLHHINDGQKKIVTAEDPIEYYLPKINQKQVSSVMSMPELLRALLRQDPDVMLFGEVRDLETGETAVRAAATGHLVLGTLHTADALGAIDRLRGLGLDNGDIASGLLGVVAQRLVRRICPRCAAAVELTDADRTLFGALVRHLTPRAGAGCDACGHSGYRGRVGLYELLVVDEELQQMIADGHPRHAMRKHLAAHGLRTLLHDGLHKVRSGLTTLEELRRMIPFRQIVTAREDAALAAARAGALEPY